MAQTQAEKKFCSLKVDNWLQNFIHSTAKEATVCLLQPLTETLQGGAE